MVVGCNAKWLRRIVATARPLRSLASPCNVPGVLILVLDPEDGGLRVPLDAALTLGRRATCGVRLDRDGVEPVHLRIEDGMLMAVHDCVVGDVPLLRGRRRLAVAGVEVRLGTARVRLEHAPIVDTPSLPTHKLVFLALKGARFHPCVRIVEGPGQGDSVELMARTVPALVGRSTEAALVVNDATVSRSHVRLSLQDGAVLVEDLGSPHGSWLGAARLAPNRIAVWPAETMLRLGTSTVLHLEPVRDATDLIPASPESAVEDDAPIEVASEREPVAPVTPEAVPKRVAEGLLFEKVLVVAAVTLGLAAVGLLVWILAS
jgi:hypothetical protein